MGKKGIKQFPSPIGELHFSITPITSAHSFKRVSVPYRGATFLNKRNKINKKHNFRVSVPYRGATFLNSEESWKIKTKPRKVSVPYRGATFLNIQNPSEESWKIKFPSPIGELHFSIPSPQPHVLSGTNRGIAGEK